MDPDLLKGTWADASRHGDRLVSWFYSWLFLEYPGTRQLFPVADMSHQRAKLVDVLGRVVSHAADLAVVVPELERLGRSHRRFGAIEGHYPAVGQALLATLEHFLGDAWTPDVEKTWTDAYATVAQVMIAAAREAERLAEPKWWDSRILFVELSRQHDRAYIVFQPPAELTATPGLTVPVSLNGTPGGWMPVQPFDVDGGHWAIYVDVDDDPLTLALAQARPGDLLRLGQPVDHFGGEA